MRMKTSIKRKVSMKIKTSINSETGKKFVAVQALMVAANKAALSLVEEVGAESFRPDGFNVAGGISSIVFPEGAVIPKWMGKSGVEGEYLPKLNFNAGGAFNAKIDGLPVVSKQDVNDCIGFDMPSGHWMNIGFVVLTEEVLVTAFEEYPFDMPTDCKEITITEYNEIACIKQMGGKRNG